MPKHANFLFQFLLLSVGFYFSSVSLASSTPSTSSTSGRNYNYEAVSLACTTSTICPGVSYVENGRCVCSVDGFTPSTAKENNQNTNTNTADPVGDCNLARSKAQIACDSNSDSGMQGVQTALSNFSTQAGQMGMGACTKLAPIMAGANSATAYFAIKCSNSRNACVKTCNDSRAVVAETNPLGLSSVEGNLETCQKLQTNVNQAQQALQNVIQTAQSISSCSEATNVNIQSYCQSNPTAIGCANVATDCSNPTVAASNQICICKNNPNAAGCTSALAKASDLNAAGSADMSSTSLKNGTTGSIDTDTMIGGTGWEGNGMTPSSSSTESVGGKKGAGANLGDGGGGGVPSGGDGRGGGAAAQAVQVNAGFRGGGGGGGGWGGGSGGGSYGGGQYGNGTQGQAQNPTGPNLRDFLPNGKMDPRVHRGMAGVSGPDGITGPHSDIWKKIQNRYQVQVEASKLMP